MFETVRVRETERGRERQRETERDRERQGETERGKGGIGEEKTERYVEIITSVGN
jgi:hypothetical protein